MFEKWKDRYLRGICDEKQLKQLVDLGKLSQAEYYEILNSKEEK